MVSTEDLISQYITWLDKYIESSASTIQKQRTIISADFLDELLKKEIESEDLLPLPPDFLEICIWSYRQLGNKQNYVVPTGKPGIITEGMAEELSKLQEKSEDLFREKLREILNTKVIPGDSFKSDFISAINALFIRRARKILFGKKTKNALWFEEPLVSVSKEGQ